MASALNRTILSARRLTTYFATQNNIRSVTANIRLFSGFENNDEPSKTPSALSEDPTTGVVWPDDLMGPLSPCNKNFPLPGNVGTTVTTKASSNSVDTYIPPQDILESASSSDRQLTVISQIIAESDYLDDDYNMTDDADDISEKIIRQYFEGATVELSLQDCPKMLYKDFHSIFLGMPQSNVTVITIAQKTVNDMSGWNAQVEEERESLVENFISTATEICQLLKAHQFWCDFIEPSSGQAYFGPYTNSTLFETDDRYTHLGFRIEDLGCCKVIAHKQWGPKVFVGTVLTTASKNHPVMKRLLQHAGK